MASKSLTPLSPAQCSASSAQLKCHSEPLLDAEESCSSKPNGSSISDRFYVSFRANSSTSDGTGETLSLSLPHSAAVCNTSETKRKSSASETKEGPRKRRRGTPLPAEENPFSEEDSGVSISAEAEGRKSRKRKSAETQGPRKKSRTEESCTADEAPSSSEPTGHSTNRAVFEAKYKEEKLLGEGGFGSVFAGYRRKDNQPVAIKHIPLSNIVYTSMVLDGEKKAVPLEVALMLQVKPAALVTRATVALLDWYDLDDKLILVMERPVPCCDLIDYMNGRGSGLQEHEAKVFAKQLVDAVMEIHSRGVFHRDIKMENILVETGSDVPCVRLIDFGCSTFLTDETYKTQQGTVEYSSPEWFTNKEYQAEPATVWQLGVLIFGLLHDDIPFKSKSDIVYGFPNVSESLTPDCSHFLLSCLSKIPEYRPTLETLRSHPWLTESTLNI